MLAATPVQNININKKEELTALGQDKLDDAEIAARLKDGRIKNQDQRDQSLEYRKLLDEYVDADGDISRAKKEHFETLRLQVVLRVLNETNIVFTTCNNAGSEIMKLGFDPTALFIDETGQLTMAGLAEVLTSFEHWIMAQLFGDPKQLPPFRLSGLANEFLKNAEMSVLALLEEKGYPVLRLTLQYRMAPAISQWVASYFYRGLLQNHPSTLVDNEYRRVAREISLQHYGREGPNKTGSEYWMIDVVNGVSKVQLNTTSLQNFANADRIAILVDQTLARGVPPSKISVLTYYTGQLSLVGQKIETKAKTSAETSGRNWELSQGYTISSVDAFQGEENEFVFIDIVVAYQKGWKGPSRADTVAEAEDSAEDDGSEGYHRSSRVNAHVKSPNRLCCALTRGRSCVVVVCQLNAVMSTVKSSQGRAAAALSAMAVDCLDRKLVYHNHTSLDTSPAGVHLRATWDAAKLEAEMRKQKAESFSFLDTQATQARNRRYVENSDVSTPKIYRTGSRRTTRPLPGALAKAADDHDIQHGENRSAIVTDAGAVPITMTGQSQRASKNKRKAAKAAKAEANSKSKDKGKGKAVDEDVGGGGAGGGGEDKGREKEPEGKGKGKAWGWIR